MRGNPNFQKRNSYFQNDCCCDESPHHGHQFGCCTPNQGHHGADKGNACCDGGLGLRRHFASPEEIKKKLETYIEVLKKELAGAEAAYKKLD